MGQGCPFTGRQVHVAQGVVVLGLGASKQVAAAAAPGQQKLQRLGEAALALAVAPVHHGKRGIEIQASGLRAERAKCPDLRSNEHGLPDLTALGHGVAHWPITRSSATSMSAAVVAVRGLSQFDRIASGPRRRQGGD